MPHGRAPLRRPCTASAVRAGEMGAPRGARQLAPPASALPRAVEIPHAPAAPREGDLPFRHGSDSRRRGHPRASPRRFRGRGAGPSGRAPLWPPAGRASGRFLAARCRLTRLAAKATAPRASLAPRRPTPCRWLEPSTRLRLVIKSAEDTVLRKLLWFRAGGEVSTVHWRDVLEVLRVSGGALDRVYLDRWAGQLGLAPLLTRAWAEASAE